MSSCDANYTALASARHALAPWTAADQWRVTWRTTRAGDVISQQHARGCVPKRIHFFADARTIPKHESCAEFISRNDRPKFYSAAEYRKYCTLQKYGTRLQEIDDVIYDVIQQRGHGVTRRKQSTQHRAYPGGRHKHLKLLSSSTTSASPRREEETCHCGCVHVYTAH